MKVLCAISVVFLLAAPVFAQENAEPVGEAVVLQANLQPSPELLAKVVVDETPAPASAATSEIKQGSSREMRFFRLSQMAMVAMTAVDMGVTAYNMTHPLHASWCDMGPDCRDRSVATITFKEAGWASVFSETNPVPVVAAHAAYTVGMLYATNWLAKKGPGWRKVATGLNFYQAGVNINAINHCFNSRSSGQSGLVPTGVFQTIRW